MGLIRLHFEPPFYISELNKPAILNKLGTIDLLISRNNTQAS